MKIAVEGCCHGELEKIYNAIECLEKANNMKVDLLLMCGDFQATRNTDDLQCMAVPPKYRDMAQFYKYYKGEKKAPILTLVIGGNHEASNHMQELSYGGWLAPNIYYLGYANIVNYGGVRIGGMSGIFKGRDYHKGHYEYPPYTNESMRTCYHTRSVDVFRLKQVSSHVDIMLSHDWPVGAVYAGDVEFLQRIKQHFIDDIAKRELGSPPAQEVLDHIKPSYWFSAHLHCKYPAVIQHKCKTETDEVKVTKFLALDKCLPRRKFLQVIDIETSHSQPYKLQLDAEWLCILKTTNHLLNLTNNNRYMPGVGCKERYDFTVTEEDKQTLLDDFGGDLTIPENFEMTVTPYDGSGNPHKGKQPPCQVNPQTTLLCQMLDITDPFAVFCGKSTTENPDEIDLDVDSDEASDSTSSAGGDNSQDDGSQTDDKLDESQAADSSINNPSADNNQSDLNQTDSEEFPTFMLSQTANESALDASIQGETPAKIREDADLGGSRKRPSTDVAVNPAADQSESMNSAVSAAAAADCETPSAMKKFKRRNVAMYSILTNQGSGEPTDDNADMD